MHIYWGLNVNTRWPSCNVQRVSKPNLQGRSAHVCRRGRTCPSTPVTITLSRNIVTKFSADQDFCPSPSCNRGHLLPLRASDSPPGSLSPRALLCPMRHLHVHFPLSVQYSAYEDLLMSRSLLLSHRSSLHPLQRRLLKRHPEEIFVCAGDHPAL